MNLVDLIEKYPDEESARAYFERVRWPAGPVCPRCGAREPYRLKARSDSKRPVRKGVLKCRKCRRQFTVTVGTVFEDSHIGLQKWLLAIHLLCSSKKGISAHQLHRMLGISYKSAWFMAHRVRYAMSRPPLVDKLRNTVEADETYVGGKASRQPGKNPEKAPVFALVERGGDLRAFPVQRVTARNLRAIMEQQVAPEAEIMTDGHLAYKGLDKTYAGHQTVDHSSGEYVRGTAHVNTAESYFSLLKRGVVGAFHHVGSQHLGRYCSEFEFRWNARELADGQRTHLAIKGAEGKRLTLKQPKDSLRRPKEG